MLSSLILLRSPTSYMQIGKENAKKEQKRATYLSEVFERLSTLDEEAVKCADAVPTMTAVGVARPREHGQAIVRTLTATLKACERTNPGR